ncbi:MAG TPA: hypothetical protein PLO61_03785 [Fimbriimonadaceae bacterium]|nr:hypothetical protein [Fimbriimonadaceae bacterium]HRJ32752.1 hypothetical protein [Fimbriimonadaceae bacterium]
MVTTLIAGWVLGWSAQEAPTPVEPPTSTPAELVSRMLERYSSAKSVTGAISLTQTYMGKSATIDTRLQYEKPGLLYVRQETRVQNGRTSLVVSNGTFFKYTLPAEVDGRPGEMLFESLNQGNKLMTYADVYAAAGRSLVDRSAPLDIVISRRDDLRFISGTWINLAWGTPVSMAGQTAWPVTGDWRENQGLNPSGKYTMWITATGDLLQYEIREALKLDDRSPAMTMLSVWTVRVEVDGKPDPALFVLPK